MTTADLSAKEQIRKLLEVQPEDSTYEEILRELAFHRMPERGLDDVDAARSLSHDEMRRRIDSWRE